MAIAQVTYTVEPMWTYEPLFNGEPWGDRNPSVAAGTPCRIQVSFKQDGSAIAPTSATSWLIYQPDGSALAPTATANPSTGVFTIDFTPTKDGRHGIEILSGMTGTTPYVYVMKRMYIYVHHSNVDPYPVVAYS